MALLRIRKKGDITLRAHCRPVDDINSRITTLLDDMAETMRNADGVGLAAPQVGVRRRIVVIETEEYGLIELINPEIIKKEGEQNEREGCLSIPGEWGYTRRPAKVTVRALDRNGNMQTYTGEDLLARAFCHEIDHLDGKLYTDPGTLVRMATPEEYEADED